MNKLGNFFRISEPIGLILLFQVFRFVLLPFMGLMPQDAYYYLYGQNLSWSYFDHPGMIGYLLRFTSELFGQSVFVVKLTDFIVTSLTMYFFYKLASQFLPKYKAKQSLLVLTSTIFVSILSFNSTPDVPLLLFWTLSVLCLQQAIFLDKKWYWILGGICMGLAFNSKYTSILLQIGLIAFLILSNKHRKKLLSPWMLVGLLISVGLTFPVVYWNYTNEFASFAFQSTQRTESISEFNITPKYFLGAVGHQLFLLLPILFALFVKATLKHITKFFKGFRLPNDQNLFLLAFFLPTFLGFFLITPFYWVKLNWMMPSYVTGVILANVFITKKLLRTQLIISGVFHVLLAVQILFYLVPIKSDDTWVGWEELSASVVELQNQYPNTFVFSDDNYKTSAALNFYLSERVYAQNIIGKNALHFDYLGDDLSELKGKDALFIDSDKRMKDLLKKGDWDKTLNNYFEQITELEPIIIQTGSKTVRKFWVYYCKNYKEK
ncbi:MAG: hypothetical protein CMB99_01820 [Flavobacteriaceae bacterium]|nr:hypothetical protein [Flavobacteriaceae bacterium]|tara:strand:- start:10671 stop:12146 length:1476 start_codon:yes stop_codon:yes gene_type:complete